MNLRSMMIVTAFAAVMLAVCIVPASAATVTVDDSGGADYTTIQAAVTAASAGDMIIVSDGTYNENVNVNKQLTIRSENGAANCNVIASSDDDVFDVMANNISITGFNVVAQSGYKGFYLSGMQYDTISNNIISGGMSGIDLRSSSSNNTITNNTIMNANASGIFIASSSNNTITNNTVINNTGSGIYITTGDNNTITNNNASDNRDHGIYLYSSSNNTLTSNTASNNEYYGIHLQSSSNNNTLTSNTASNNALYGIYLYSSSNNNMLSNNTASNNTQYGIYLSSSNNNTIYDNYFNNTNNAWDNGNNIWNTTKTAGINIIGGSWLGGNYWSDYAGVDTNFDGLGDTLIPYNSSGDIDNGGDYHPLVVKLAPIISINAPINDSTISDSTPELNTTFNGETVAYVWYNVNNVVNMTPVQNTDNLTVTLSSLSDGLHNVTVYANDSFGNLNSSIVYFTVDATLPIPTFVSPTPADNSNLSQSYIDTNVTVTETNLKNITAYIYNSTDLVVSNVSLSSPLLYNFTSLDDGTYYINATAYDTAGNSNITETRTIVLDTISPIAPTITMPLDSSTLALSTTWVNGTISADTTNVTVYVNGTATNTSVSVSSTTYNISNVPLGADGSYEINVSAIDSAGNVNTTNATAIVTIDTTPPTAPTNLVHTDADVSNDNYDNDNSTDISWSASIDASTVTYRVYRDGALNDSTTSLTYTFTNETEGTHIYNVSAIDSVGNINTTNASVTVIVDYTDPVIHNLSLSDTSPSYGQAIIVTVNVTDTNLANVTAGSTSLTHQSGALWNGTITAGYGVNTVTVIAYDNASNSATNTSLSYTGPAASTNDDTSSGPINRPTPLPENVVNKEVKGTVFNEPVTSADLKFDKGYVTLVTVDAKGTISEVMITVQKLAGKPSEIKVAPPSGSVHTYHNIDLGRIGDDDLEGATIKFKAEKKWIAENGGDRNAVVVMRYHDDWMALETEPTGEDDEYVFFSARTPGFSTFAITMELEEEVVPVEVETPELVVEEVVDEPLPEPQEEKSYWWLVLVIAGIVGVIFFVYKNKKDESEE